MPEQEGMDRIAHYMTYRSHMLDENSIADFYRRAESRRFGAKKKK
jgi:hypothetical protein